MVGKYVDLTESYKSLSEALTHAGIHTRSKVHIHYVDSEAVERDGADCLAAMDGILVPGGFGKRGVEHIKAIRYARENGIPYLGICLGMQLAVIEYARTSPLEQRRNSTRIRRHTVVALVTEWQNRDGSIERRAANSDLGGTMRLGGQPCEVVPGSLAHRIYGSTTVAERHRHRYEVNNHYLPRLEVAGLTVGARPQRGRRRSVRDDRIAAAPVVLRLRVSSPSSRRIRAAIRCSSGSSVPRSSISSAPGRRRERRGRRARRVDLEMNGPHAHCVRCPRGGAQCPSGGRAGG